jgi:hypothetical protein
LFAAGLDDCEHRSSSGKKNQPLNLTQRSISVKYACGRNLYSYWKTVQKFHLPSVTVIGEVNHEKTDTGMGYIGLALLSGLAGAALVAFLLRPQAKSNGRFFSDYPAYDPDRSPRRQSLSSPS